MFRVELLCLFVCVLVCENDSARILAYYPGPSISHQIVFRPLTLELVNRGHEVTVITPDPLFTEGDGPVNLTEIDVHDVSYAILKKEYEKARGNINFNLIMLSVIKIIEAQINTADVRKLRTSNAKFDLLLVQAQMEPALAFSRIFDAPIIQFSSIGIYNDILNNFGTAVHPFIYPTLTHKRLFNLTLFEKLEEWYNERAFDQIVPDNMELYDGFLKRALGEHAPSFTELRKNVDLLFLNVHPIWDFNRPVPPNVVYLGGLHQQQQKELPKDLQTYLDSSKNGVIYVSFGSNVDPAVFFAEKVQTLVNVFSKLPYDVLWKWNYDELPGRTANIKIMKWLPQADLLRHPKVKLFIMQGGMQSTDEAITAGVPMVGIPIMGDQFFNVEQYLHFKIGERVDIKTITEDKLNNAINLILRDDSYRKNVAKLRSIINDHPQTPLERAVWWTEYVIRHKGAKHLRSPAANMPMAEYLELQLITSVLLTFLLISIIVISLLYFVYSVTFRRTSNVKKVKKN